MVRGRRMTLRNREYVQGKSATKAMCRTSTSVKPSSKVGIVPMSANKRRKLLSVLCSSSSDEVMSQQGHMAQLQRS